TTAMPPCAASRIGTKPRSSRAMERRAQVESTEIKVSWFSIESSTTSTSAGRVPVLRVGAHATTKPSSPAKVVRLKLATACIPSVGGPPAQQEGATAPRKSDGLLPLGVE